jgi:hypothetical protein
MNDILSTRKIDLTNTYSEQSRSKLLVIRLTTDESNYVSKLARSSGNTITSFTREALQFHIDRFIDAGH